MVVESVEFGVVMIWLVCEWVFVGDDEFVVKVEVDLWVL